MNTDPMKQKNRVLTYLKVIREATKNPEVSWKDAFDERQRKELQLASYYRQNLAHGTTGHNQLMLIDELADFIDTILTSFELVEKD